MEYSYDSGGLGIDRMTQCMTTPNILWRIENFSSVYKKVSPTIRFMGLKFYMSLSQYMEAGAARLQLNLGCENASETFSSLQFKVEVGIFRNGSCYMSKSAMYNFSRSEWCIWADFVSNIYRTFGEINDVIFLIMITPSCKQETIFRSEGSDEIKELAPCVANLSEDIGKLFNNADCSDFTLKCGNRSFFVHKAILSARSHFFAAMFRCDMKEANEKDGKIEKMEPEILELVLRYLYTGELPHLSMDSVQKVYTAAERFIVDPLKIKCLSLFMNNLTNEPKEDSEKQIEESVVEQNETAEKHVNDIEEHQTLKNLFMSREWRLFSERFPHKAHEMCKPYLLIYL